MVDVIRCLSCNFVSSVFRLSSTFQVHLESTINFTGSLLRLPRQNQGRATLGQGRQISVLVVPAPAPSCQQRNTMRIHLKAKARTAAW